MNLLIKDNFFNNVNELRNIALATSFLCSEDVKVDVGWRGYRTEELETFNNPILDEAGKKILNAVCSFFNVDGYSISTHFHLSHTGTKKTLEDFENKKYHFDQCKYAGVVYLTPDAPTDMGTSVLDGENNQIINTKNKYNRLLSYPANLIHAPTDLFGSDMKTGRMTLTFFLNKDWTWD